MGSRNNDALRLLADSTFDVKLKSLNGEEVALICRELPLSTLTYVTSVVIVKASEGAVGALSDLSANLVRLIELLGEENERTRLEQRIANVIGTAIPLMTSLATEIPDLVTRVLCDCILDAGPEEVELLSTSHSLTVFGEIAKRIDPKDIAEKLKPVFTLAAGVTKESTTKSPSKKAPAKSTPSPKQK